MSSNPTEVSTNPGRQAQGVKPTAPSDSTPTNVEPGDVSNGPADPRATALEADIMQCARLGEIGLLQKIFDSGKFNAQHKDHEGTTPLHVSLGTHSLSPCSSELKLGAIS
jgi:palmitoyltransferase ZDHHC13/17